MTDKYCRFKEKFFFFVEGTDETRWGQWGHVQVWWSTLYFTTEEAVPVSPVMAEEAVPAGLAMDPSLHVFLSLFILPVCSVLYKIAVDVYPV